MVLSSKRGCFAGCLNAGFEFPGSVIRKFGGLRGFGAGLKLFGLQGLGVDGFRARIMG